MADQDTFSVVVPVRNGAGWIRNCLGSIAQLDPRPDEVIVVDGSSDDGTAELATVALRDLGLPGNVLCHPQGTISGNLNTALAAARGTYMVRVDVRSEPPQDYLTRVSHGLGRPGVVLVGGIQVPVPARRGWMAGALTRAQQNHVLAGLATYRRPGRSGPAETVYLGGARTSTLRQLGGWDERLIANEDYDLARRAAGLGTVWLDGDLPIRWYPPDRLGPALGRLHRYGRAKADYWLRAGQRPAARQWLALLAPVGATAMVAVAARRSPMAAAATTAAACLATDLTVARPAPVGVRATSVVVGVAGALAWWAGVARGGWDWIRGSPTVLERRHDHGRRVCHGHLNAPTSDVSRAALCDQVGSDASS